MSKDARRGLRSSMIVTFIAVATLPILILGMVFYRISYQTVMTIAKNDATFMLEKNIAAVNAKLEGVRERAIAMSTDMELYAVFSEFVAQPAFKPSQYFTLSRKVSSILWRYFPISANLYSTCIVTRDFTFTNSSQPMPTYDTLVEMGIMSEALRADGDIAWIPTYDYVNAMRLNALSGLGVDYQYMISAVRKLNIISSFEGYATFKQTDTPPILMLNMKPDALGNAFDNHDGSSYAIYTANGELVTSGGEKPPLFVEAIDGQSLISRGILSPTGWIVVRATPLTNILGRVSNMPDLVLLLAAILAVIAVVIGLRFNAMSERIAEIVEESHQREIKAREAEIQTLNVQINPHFLYNTLGLCNFMVLEGGNIKASKLLVALSGMLRYTSKRGQELVPLMDDIVWIEKYLLIMRVRFDGKFAVEMNMVNAHLNVLVPKLFLQPFIENAILHGFSDMSTGGKLTVLGAQEGTHMQFVVEDNGKGMPQAQAEAILAGQGESVGINNVARRLKLIYGERADISMLCTEGHGVRVRICIPFQP